MSDDLAHELRVMARLMETKASITWREQDAAQLRKAADEIERLRAALRIEEWRKILNDLVAGERAENERLCAALNGVVEAARFTQGLHPELVDALKAAAPR